MSQSDIIFDPEKGLQVPETDRILAFVQEEFKKVFGNDINLDPSSPQGQLITSLAAMIATKNTELLKLANQFNPLTAQGLFQEALGKIYFMDRKVAQPTIVLCECRGLIGTVIPANAIVESADGVRFYCSGERIIDETQNILVEFFCERSGEVQVQPHSINRIITVVPGWDSVNNPNAGVTGRLKETQGEFERRRYASVAKNSHGTVAAIYGTLADIDGVVDLVVLENRTNEPITQAGVTIDGHSVYISVFGGKDEDIASAIYHKIDCGCGTTGTVNVTHIAKDFGNAVYVYQINRPAELPVYINVKIKKTESTPATVVDDIKKAVLANFNGTDSASGVRVKMGETLYASKFYCAILDEGVQELLEIGVSLDNSAFTSSVFIPADKFPTLSTNNVNVELSD